MGLVIEAAPKNSDIDTENYYSEASCGYGTFKTFRDMLIEFCTNKKYNLDNVLALTSNHLFIYDFNTFDVTMKDEFNSAELNEKEVQEYIKGLDDIENRYPMLYKVWAFVNHSDCEGEIDSSKIKDALPVLKLFLQDLKNNSNEDKVVTKYCEDLIVVFEDCINNNGKLIYL